VTFALEGAVSMAGQSVRWLRDNLEFFKEAKDVGENEKFNAPLILSVEKRSNKCTIYYF
jgi:glycerol kinase